MFNTVPLANRFRDNSIEAGSRFNKLVFYRIINMKEEDAGRHFAVTVFVRLINMKDGAVLWAGLLHGFSHGYPKKAVRQYYEAGAVKMYQTIYEAIRNSFPKELAARIKLAYLVPDNPAAHEFRYSGEREFTQTVEEAFTAALSVMSYRSVSGKISPVFVKKPWQYDRQIFYVSPVLADSWKWLNQKQGVEFLVIYRILKGELLGPGGPERFSIAYRVVNARENGTVVAGGLIGVGTDNPPQVRYQAEEGIIKGWRLADDMFKACGAHMKGDKNVIIIREDYLPVTYEYSDLLDQDYSLEDGMYSFFAEKGVKITEKLGGLYLRRQEDYYSPYFVFDPLFISRWPELHGQKADMLLFYRLIRSNSQNPNSPPDAAALRVGYRLIDVNAGKVVHSGLTY